MLFIIFIYKLIKKFNKKNRHYIIIFIKKSMEVKTKDKTTMKINNSKYTNFKESVKSKYIQELIISFLNETYSLDLIKYNKKLQNIFEININTYKEKKSKYKNR